MPEETNENGNKGTNETPPPPTLKRNLNKFPPPSNKPLGLQLLSVFKATFVLLYALLG